jgi:FKBP-type peptidyl-prolyl cis-trans isomerase
MVLYPKLLPTESLCGPVLGALGLALLLYLPQATATETAAAGHSAHDHAHHQHAMAPGYQRSLASYPIPELTLLNQHGQRVALPELLAADKPLMLNFIFTSCTAICPAMSAIFAKVQTELGEDSTRVNMVSISIDPEQDTPEVLSSYAQRFQAGPQWQFLTGSLEDSIAAQKAFDADRGDKMNHAPLTLYRATPQSQWIRYEGFVPATELVAESRNEFQADTRPAAQPHAVQNQAGYSAGYAFGGRLSGLQRQGQGVELEDVFQGILDALSGAEPRISAEQMHTALQELETEQQDATAESAKSRSIRARSRGYVDDFAANNARREGVVSLPSGVQYEVLKPGNGERPGGDDAVLVSYQASLTNGAVFDSTFEDGEPTRLALEEIVVPGLKEALLLMNEGARWRVVIPPEMGFRTAGNNMLRRRDLIYDIELVSVESSAQAATTGEVLTPADTTDSPPAASH